MTRPAFPIFLPFAIAAVLWSSSAALGQEAGPEKPVQFEEIVVTGSRLPFSASEAVGPVIILGKMDLERAATDALAQVLQDLPVQTGPTTNTHSELSDGSARVNLRGLGDARTLVLLNGRRFIFGGLGADSSVDLNMIPLSMVERVEVSGSGASAIYGADAVAGVVNVITRKQYTGTDIGGDFQISERGDGATRTAHAVTGMNLGRASLSIGAEYVDQDGVGDGARPYSSHVESLVTPQGPVVNTPSLYTADGSYIVPTGNRQGLVGTGLGLFTRVAGSSGAGAADFRPFDPRVDSLNYAPYLLLQSPSKRGSAWMFGRGEWSDSIEWFSEGLISTRRSETHGPPSDYSNFRAGAAPVDPATGAQIIPANNFYNPFGVDIPALFRTLTEGQARVFAQDLKSYRLLLGLRGELRGWHLESAVTWARNDATETQSGQLLRDPLRVAVGPSGRNSAGDVVCGVPDPATGIVPMSAIIPGCVPLDLFGGAGPGGHGTITPRQLAYISRTLRNSGANQHWVVDAQAIKSLTKLPAGDLSVAIGGQFRREQGELSVDPLTGRGVADGFSYTVPSDAVIEAREAFAEARIPLVKGIPAMQAVDLNLGMRYSQFSGFGTHTSLQGGIHWNVGAGVTVRGGYSQVFRAPGTLDSFAAPQFQVAPIDDPCGLGPSPAQRAHCAAAGVPGGSYVQPNDAGTPVVYGGNPRLGPESGASWSAGVQFEPQMLRGMRATADFWHVQLTHAIESGDPQTIVDECSDTGSMDACRLIHRNADGSILQIDGRSANLNRELSEGVDVSLSMEHVLSPGNSLSVRALGTYLTSVRFREFDAGTDFPVAGTFDGGTTSWPRWRAQFGMDWLHGGWRASYSAQYTDSQQECGDKIFPADFAYFSVGECRSIASRVFHGISGAYHWDSGLTLSAAVANLTDLAPPRVNTSTNGNTDTSIYPVLGRTYLLRAAFHFR
jgi:iron complex outermembrane receptor protein